MARRYDVDGAVLYTPTGERVVFAGFSLTASEIGRQIAEQSSCPTYVEPDGPVCIFILSGGCSGAALVPIPIWMLTAGASVNRRERREQASRRGARAW